MKRVLLIIFLCFVAQQGYSQATIYGIYGGAGCATTNNYDVAPSGGLDFLFGGRNGGRLWIGFDAFYQNYSLYADNEANSAKNGQGYAGTLDRFNASYAYLAPKFSYDIGRRTGFVKLYLDFGVGYNINGYDSLRKWDYSYSTISGTNGAGQYDSVLGKTKNISKLMFRGGFGLTEYMHMGGHWWFSFTEDFGFVTNNLTSTGTPTDPSRTQYSTNGLKPGYISLQVGILHFKRHENNY